MRRLLLSEDDLRASNDCVLVAAFNSQSNDLANPDFYCRSESAYLVPLLAPDTHKTATGRPNIAPASACDALVIFDVETDPNERGFVYFKVDPESGQSIQHLIWPGSAVVINLPAFRILQTVAPGLAPRDIYRFFTSPRHEDARRQIDYGYVRRSENATIPIMSMCGDDDPVRWWQALLYDRRRSDESIIREAWLGQGNLWKLARPDRSV